MTVAIDPPGDPPIIQPGVSLHSLSTEISFRVLSPKAPLWWWVGFSFGFVLFLWLLVAVSWLFANGIGVWGVNIPVAWGYAIAEYVWWIALASGGTVISALFYLTRSPWRAATNRIAETMLLAAAACAGVMPILHLGRQGLFYWLFTYPNVMGLWPQMRSPLWWDFTCLLCYVLMSLMFYYVGALPDLATVRDLARTRFSQVFYGLLALGWRGTARHWRNHKAVYGTMAAIMAPMVISVHSVVGLDYAGGLTPGWHSTQFPPFFFFGAVTSGTAIVIILTILVRWGYSLQDVITEYHLNALAKVMLVGSVMLSYAYFWEAWGLVYSSDLATRLEFYHRMFGFTAATFWVEKVLSSIIPQLLWFPAVRRSPVILLLISGGIIVGMWLERYTFTISGLMHNHVPSWWFEFHPTFWDWSTLFGTVGLFITLFFLLLRFMPIVSMSEVREMIDKADSK